MYSISAGSHDGTLDTLDIRTGHATSGDALAALRRYLRGLGHTDLIVIECDDGDYVYLSQEGADADDTGAYAEAVIAPDEARKGWTRALDDMLDESADR